MSTKVSLEDIRTDGGTQPRANLNHDVISEYTAELIGGTRFPPVMVYYDGEVYWLADGFHRYRAHEQAGFESINCEVNQGSRRDAVLASVGVNAKHGLRRTNADKRRAVTKLLEDDEWSKWSDHEIARRCQVSSMLVGKVRKETINIYSMDPDKPDLRTYVHPKTGNETTMDISKMGGEKKEPETPSTVEVDEEPLEDEPFGGQEEEVGNGEGISDEEGGNDGGVETKNGSLENDEQDTSQTRTSKKESKPYESNEQAIKEKDRLFGGQEFTTNTRLAEVAILGLDDLVKDHNDFLDALAIVIAKCYKRARKKDVAKLEEKIEFYRR